MENLQNSVRNASSRVSWLSNKFSSRWSTRPAWNTSILQRRRNNHWVFIGLIVTRCMSNTSCRLPPRPASPYARLAFSRSSNSSRSCTVSVGLAIHAVVDAKRACSSEQLHGLSRVRSYLEIIGPRRQELISNMQRSRPFNAAEILLTGTYAPCLITDIDENIAASWISFLVSHTHSPQRNGTHR